MESVTDGSVRIELLATVALRGVANPVALFYRDPRLPELFADENLAILWSSKELEGRVVVSI